MDATITDGVDTFEGSEEVDLDGGWVLSGAAGMSLANNLRVEGELLYLTNKVGSGAFEDAEIAVGEIEVSNIAGFVNVLYDIPMGELEWVPYVGAGVGYGETTLEIEGEEASNNGLTWQLRAGISVPGGPDNMRWDIGYRYLRVAEFEADAEIDIYDFSLQAEPTIHVLSLGVRYGF